MFIKTYHLVSMFLVATSTWADSVGTYVFFAKVNGTLKPLNIRNDYKVEYWMTWGNSLAKPTEFLYENNRALSSIGNAVFTFDKGITVHTTSYGTELILDDENRLKNSFYYSCKFPGRHDNLILSRKVHANCFHVEIYFLAYDSIAKGPVKGSYTFQKDVERSPYVFFIEGPNNWDPLYAESFTPEYSGLATFNHGNSVAQPLEFFVQNNYAITESGDQLSGYAGFSSNHFGFGRNAHKTSLGLGENSKLSTWRFFSCRDPRASRRVIVVEVFPEGDCFEVDVYLLPYNRTSQRPVKGSYKPKKRGTQITPSAQSLKSPYSFFIKGKDSWENLSYYAQRIIYGQLEYYVFTHSQPAKNPVEFSFKHNIAYTQNELALGFAGFENDKLVFGGRTPQSRLNLDTDFKILDHHFHSCAEDKSSSEREIFVDISPRDSCFGVEIYFMPLNQTSEQPVEGLDKSRGDYGATTTSSMSVPTIDISSESSVSISSDFSDYTVSTVISSSESLVSISSEFSESSVSTGISSSESLVSVVSEFSDYSGSTGISSSESLVSISSEFLKSSVATGSSSSESLVSITSYTPEVSVSTGIESSESLVLISSEFSESTVSIRARSFESSSSISSYTPEPSVSTMTIPSKSSVQSMSRFPEPSVSVIARYFESLVQITSDSSESLVATTISSSESLVSMRSDFSDSSVATRISSSESLVSITSDFSESSVPISMHSSESLVSISSYTPNFSGSTMGGSSETSVASLSSIPEPAISIMTESSNHLIPSTSKILDFTTSIVTRSSEYSVSSMPGPIESSVPTTYRTSESLVSTPESSVATIFKSSDSLVSTMIHTSSFSDSTMVEYSSTSVSTMVGYSSTSVSTMVGYSSTSVSTMVGYSSSAVSTMVRYSSTSVLAISENSEIISSFISDTSPSLIYIISNSASETELKMSNAHSSGSTSISGASSLSVIDTSRSTSVSSASSSNIIDISSSTSMSSASSSNIIDISRSTSIFGASSSNIIDTSRSTSMSAVAEESTFGESGSMLITHTRETTVTATVFFKWQTDSNTIEWNIHTNYTTHYPERNMTFTKCGKMYYLSSTVTSATTVTCTGVCIVPEIISEGDSSPQGPTETPKVNYYVLESTEKSSSPRNFPKKIDTEEYPTHDPNNGSIKLSNKSKTPKPKSGSSGGGKTTNSPTPKSVNSHETTTQSFAATVTVSTVSLSVNGAVKRVIGAGIFGLAAILL